MKFGPQTNFACSVNVLKVCAGLSRLLTLQRTELLSSSQVQINNTVHYRDILLGWNLLLAVRFKTGESHIPARQCCLQSAESGEYVSTLNMRLLLFHRDYDHPTAQTLMRSTTTPE